MPKSALSENSTVLKKLREFCLELPETTETMSWGKPHFCVGKKIFVGAYQEDGRIIVGFQLEMGHAQQIVEDPRFWLVGKKGGVCMDATNVKDWQQVKNLVRESYCMLAPEKLSKQVIKLSAPKKTNKTKTPAK